jgi:subtilisin family serine protease
VGKLRFVALVVVVIAGLGAPPSRAVDTTPSTWIVTVQPGVDVTLQARTLALAAGGTAGFVYSHVLGGFSFIGTTAAADLLRASPVVTSVVPDGPAHLAATTATSPAQLVPTGVSRISGPAATAAGYTGAGVTVAVIDSGIDLVHPDLLANIHPSLGANCSNPLLPPADDNSHGTHVAGTIAAADNGVGVVGVAPAATLVPVKAFDAAGDSTWSIVICGIDYVAAHADAIDVVNMSFGDLSTEPTACDGVTTSDFDALRQSICDLAATGVISVAAAGNNMIDVAGFVPAAFPEVITVSAIADTDGAPGGLGGCIVFGAICDDGFASLFSNYGPRIDVMAPGLEILSTMPGGAYATKDGTSMAAPHATGVVALMAQAHPGLTTDQARLFMMRSGECPDGTTAGTDATCGGQGAWALDPDTEAEPLLHAQRAALLAAGPPTAAVAAPANNAIVAGTTTLAVTASDVEDAAGTLAVSTRIDGGAWQTAAWNASTGRYQRAWDTRTAANGTHTIEAMAVDSDGLSAISTPITVTVRNGMHVADIDGARSISKKSWKATATVTVRTAAEALLSGATVSFSWSGGYTGTGSCITSRKGVCSASSGAMPLAAAGATFTVTGLSAAGQVYAPGANADPDGDSNGTSLTVNRV